MTRFPKKRSKKSGLPPGSLIHIGEKKTEKTKITITDFDETYFQEREVKTIEECFPLPDLKKIRWIQIDGIHQEDIVGTIGKQFSIHPLLLEDIMNTDQRPKIEDFGDYIFVVLKTLSLSEKNSEINVDQISLIFGANFVLTFHEKENVIFHPVVDRLRNGKGKIRKLGADYLAYALLDAIVDSYFIVIEKIAERIELLEEKLITNPSKDTLHTMHALKREMIFLRKSVWPLREVLGYLERLESSLIKESTRMYFRDVYDHTVQVIDAIETYREIISEMFDIYLSSISNRLNEVMKVLTIIATIFMPLTLITGIYGMNFKYMPELEWQYGYYVVIGLIAVIGISMAIYFKRRKWI